MHPLTILIRQSTRTSECQLVPHTAFIAGHICVPVGGGEDVGRAFVASWAFYRNYARSTGPT
jgi:hypothetical protein